MNLFVVSLDQISKRLKIPGNVAGASLMAMGSSAPELAIALLSLVIAGGTHSDVGVGTIVGSALFNILIISGVSAVVRPITNTWRVVVRDLVMYVISVTLLIVVFADCEIALWEATLLIILYAIYIVVLFNWEAFGPDEQDDPIGDISAEIDEEREGANPFFLAG